MGRTILAKCSLQCAIFFLTLESLDLLKCLPSMVLSPLCLSNFYSTFRSLGSFPELPSKWVTCVSIYKWEGTRSLGTSKTVSMTSTAGILWRIWGNVGKWVWQSSIWSFGTKSIQRERKWSQFRGMASTCRQKGQGGSCCCYHHGNEEQWWSRWLHRT